MLLLLLLLQDFGKDTFATWGGGGCVWLYFSVINDIVVVFLHVRDTKSTCNVIIWAAAAILSHASEYYCIMGMAWLPYYMGKTATKHVCVCISIHEYHANICWLGTVKEGQTGSHDYQLMGVKGSRGQATCWSCSIHRKMWSDFFSRMIYFIFNYRHYEKKKSPNSFPF